MELAKESLPRNAHQPGGLRDWELLIKCFIRQPAAPSLTHLNKCQGTLNNSCKPSTQKDPADMATECGNTIEEELKGQNKIDEKLNFK